MSEDWRAGSLSRALGRRAPAAAELLAKKILEKRPGSAAVLYGSGISVLLDKDPRDVLHDFYVVAPSYRAAYSSLSSRIMNFLLPPNVYYIETQTPDGLLRAKYAVVSIRHLERLVSRKTFHSYFWARFAQPCRIVAGPTDLRHRIEACAATAIDTFVARAAPLVPPGSPPATIWREGLRRSYRAELRVEKPGRVSALLESYGDWPGQVTRLAELKGEKKNRFLSEFAWRLRALQGAVLSVLRIAKGTATFQGGVDYMVWKVRRHTGIDVPVKAWERRIPLIGGLFITRRYYELRGRREK